MPDTPTPPETKTRLVRDLIVFQVKLFADGLRDLLLSPLSFIAALTDIITGKQGPDANFYSLLRAGKKSDGWIDLFGAGERPGPDGGDSELDRALDKLETEIAASYRDGRLSAAAKDALQRASTILGTAAAPAKPATSSAETTGAEAAASAAEPANTDTESTAPASQPSDDKS